MSFCSTLGFISAIPLFHPLELGGDLIMLFTLRRSGRRRDLGGGGSGNAALIFPRLEDDRLRGRGRHILWKKEKLVSNGEHNLRCMKCPRVARAQHAFNISLRMESFRLTS